jgi:hypothetical protein
MSLDRDDAPREAYDYGDPGEPDYEAFSNHDGVTADDCSEPDADDLPPDSWPLLDAARSFVRGTAAGEALNAKLEAFDRLGDEAKARAAPQIRADIATVVARVITADHQRQQFEEALREWRAAPDDSEVPGWQERHPLIVRLLELAEEILSELGKEMLFKMLFGAPVPLPPTDFVEAVFSLLTMWEATKH